ncbi:hypothetical protein BDW22DRAFT_1356287 [Trametopsis cervina]|nr:hypothetical protein BDW22DRAFT_1356287 [Trametopsis cervina]
MHDVLHTSHECAEFERPEQAPAAPLFVATTRAPCNSSSTPSDPKSLSVILLLVGGLCFIIQWLYDYVGLFALHLFYLNSMVDTPSCQRDDCHNSHDHRNSDTEYLGRPPVWISLLEDFPKRCRSTLCVAAMCLCASAFVIQYSFQALPRMCGFISLVVVLDGVLTSLLLSSLLHLMKLNETTLHDRVDHPELMRAARLFAVPLSSLIWCLLATTVSIVAFCLQTGAAAIELPVFQEGHVVSGNTGQAQPPSTPTVQQMLPKWSVIMIVLVTIIVILRFIYVLYSVIRPRQYTMVKHDSESICAMANIRMGNVPSAIGCHITHTTTPATPHAPSQMVTPPASLTSTILVQQPETISAGVGITDGIRKKAEPGSRLIKRSIGRTRESGGSGERVRPSLSRTSVTDSEDKVGQAAGALVSGE